MPVFAYAGTARGGKSVTAEINADTRELAIEQLRSQGITVKSIEEKKKAKALFGERKQKITDKDIVVFTRQFATMINAGLPLVQCLEILSTQCTSGSPRSEEHTSELQSLAYLVCRLLLEKKKAMEPPPLTPMAHACRLRGA